MERLLDELACAYMVRYHDHEAKDAAHAQLYTFFDLAIAGFPLGSLPERNTAQFNSHYLAEELTRRQCVLFAQALAPTAPEI
jgi:hypothetical protein